MAFRKIIGFGDSSFVVSLPKDWVEKNGLKKGDIVNVEQEASELKVTPQNLKQSIAPKEITINFEGNLKLLKSQLFNSYINGCSLINIQKKDISNYYADIKKLVNDFVALEIIQSSGEKIVVKDYLNIQDISIYDNLRRMDRIVMSMFDDVKEIFKGDESKKGYILERDDDVNRMYNLILKLLKKALNLNDRKILNLNIEEIFYYWDLVGSLEEVADQLKRVVRYLGTSKNVDKRVIELYDQVYDHYKQAMKANFTHNEALCLNIMNMRKEVFEKCEKYAEELDNNSGLVLEKIKLIHSSAGNIARAYIKLGIRV